MFFTAAKAFFMSKAGVVVLITVLGVVLGAVGYHKAVVWGLQSQLKDSQELVGKLQVQVGDLTTKNAALTSANEAWAESAKKQSAAITAFETKMREQARLAAEALERERLERAKWKGQYDSLLNQAPSNSADLCGSWFNLLDQYLILRVKEAAR